MSHLFYISCTNLLVQVLDVNNSIKCQVLKSEFKLKNELSHLN